MKKKKKQIIQLANSTNWYLGKQFCKKKKRGKTHVLLENNQVARISSQKKKTPTELPQLRHNKVFNTWNRANVMKIIPGQRNSEELFGET